MEINVSYTDITNVFIDIFYAFIVHLDCSLKNDDNNKW